MNQLDIIFFIPIFILLLFIIWFLIYVWTFFLKLHRMGRGIVFNDLIQIFYSHVIFYFVLCITMTLVIELGWRITFIMILSYITVISFMTSFYYLLKTLQKYRPWLYHSLLWYKITVVYALISSNIVALITLMIKSGYYYFYEGTLFFTLIILLFWPQIYILIGIFGYLMFKYASKKYKSNPENISDNLAIWRRNKILITIFKIYFFLMILWFLFFGFLGLASIW